MIPVELNTDYIIKEDIIKINEENSTIYEIDPSIEKILFLTLNLKTFIVINKLFRCNTTYTEIFLYGHKDEYSYTISIEKLKILFEYIITYDTGGKSNFYFLNDVGILTASLITFNYSLDKSLNSENIDDIKKWVKISKNIIGELLPINTTEHYSHRYSFLKKTVIPNQYIKDNKNKLMKSKYINDIISLLFCCLQQPLSIVYPIKLDQKIILDELYYMGIKTLDNTGYIDLTYEQLNELIKLNMFYLNTHGNRLYLNLGFIGYDYMNSLSDRIFSKTTQEIKNELNDYLSKMNV